MLTVGDSNLPLQRLEKLWREESLFPSKAHISVALLPARLGPKHASSPSPCPQRLQELNQSSVRMEGSTLQSAWQPRANGKWPVLLASAHPEKRQVVERSGLQLLYPRTPLAQTCAHTSQSLFLKNSGFHML